MILHKWQNIDEAILINNNHRCVIFITRRMEMIATPRLKIPWECVEYAIYDIIFSVTTPIFVRIHGRCPSNILVNSQWQRFRYGPEGLRGERNEGMRHSGAIIEKFSQIFNNHISFNIGYCQCDETCMRVRFLAICLHEMMIPNERKM